ncbi:MAG TPA: hypothetical protein VFR81_26340 [Longimicrobium sp.]|nr:hypothetical protein [Longimicrobium sp.]
MRYTTSVPATVLALLLTAACDSSELVSPDPGDGAVTPTPRQEIRTPDDEFARAAKTDVPGFAGYYLQDDGTPVIRLVDTNQRAAAQRYLAQHFMAARMGRHKGAAQAPIVKPATYDFAQLKGWADGLTPMLSRSDVFLIDVDEKENRVMVGVQDAGAIAAVRAEGLRLGIPGQALFVKTQGRPETRATVRDRFTTTVGGIQIAFSQYVCTLGFNARRVSTGANIYVTNAHCSGTQYANDGIAIYQNTVASGNQIGNEVADRGMYACAGTGTSCRRADAIFVSNNGTRTVGQGGIARTAWNTGGPGGLTVTGEYDVVGRYTGSVPVGTYLDKTGRTSGSTYGQVTNSCVTIGVLRCQDISTVWSEGGDSGSPMYYYLGGSGAAENDVQLYGILWGGPNGDWNTTYSSRLSGIEQDLGTLSNLCRPGYGC